MTAPTPISRTARLLNSGLCTAALLLLSQLMMLPTSSPSIAPILPVAQQPSGSDFDVAPQAVNATPSDIPKTIDSKL